MRRRSDDPQAVLRSALGDLRDRTVAAIKDSRLADVDDALELYKQLMVAALDLFDELDAAASPTGASGFLRYGREMDWLARDAGALMVSALATGAVETIYALQGLPFDLMVEGWRRGSLALFEHGLDLYGRCWSEAMTALEPRPWSRVRDSLLLQLGNFADFYLLSGRGEVSPELQRDLAMAEMRLLSQCARLAVDNGRADDLRRVIGVVHRSFAQGSHVHQLATSDAENGGRQKSPRKIRS